MNTYYMRHQIRWQYGIILLLMIFGAGGIGYLLKQKLVIPNSDIVLPCVVIGLGWLGFYLARRTSVADVAITVGDAGISQTWLSQAVFSDKPDVFIRWEDMAEYMYEPGFRGSPDIFRITLTNGEKWRLFRYVSFKKDDFERFRADFSAKTEMFNEINNVNGLMILEAKTSLQAAGGTVLAALLMIVMVGLPIAMMVRPDMINLGALGVIYPMGLPILILIYTQRKKRREYERRLAQQTSSAVQEKGGNGSRDE